MLKVLTVVGTRSDLIQSAPVSRALREAGILEYTVHTGQHTSPLLSGAFMDELELNPPDLDLSSDAPWEGVIPGPDHPPEPLSDFARLSSAGVPPASSPGVPPGGSTVHEAENRYPAAAPATPPEDFADLRETCLRQLLRSPHAALQTGAMLAVLDQAILRQQPHWVLVYGASNSALAGALAAVRRHAPIAHAGAGLRSFNRRMPEEINRVLIDAIAALLLAPHRTAFDNLLREGRPAERVCSVGDLLCDALQLHQNKAALTTGVLADLALPPKSFALVTIHRAENIDDPDRLRAIFEGLRGMFAQMRVILPLHPRTYARLKQLPDLALKSLEVIHPVGYLDMLRLESAAAVIVTDSISVPREAFFHGVPCVIPRDETESPDLVSSGWNRLVSPLKAGRIVETVQLARGAPTSPVPPCGDGHAAERIAAALRAHYARQ